MSTNDAPADKSRHDSDADGKLADLPGQWWPAAKDDEAFLVHESGARLVIRRSAPTHRPRTERERINRPFELDFQPADRQVLRVISREGSRFGQRDAALAFAREWPRAEPDESAFSLHETGWSK